MKLRSFSRLVSIVSLFLAAPLVISVGCTAPGPDIDADGDKLADDLGSWVNVGADGLGAPIDLNGDGLMDGPGVDTNGDGVADAVALDTDGDGIYDALDTDGDGIADTKTSVGTDEPVTDDTKGTGGTTLKVGQDEPDPESSELTCVTVNGVEECYCLRVAVIGTADSAASDTNATAFRDWLNTKSNALVTIFDPKDPTDPRAKPELNAEFLASFDVLVLQLQGESKDGPFWSYTDAEVAAVKAWVEAGGGIISLTGYNGGQAAAETAASNSLLQPVTGMSYGTTDIAGNSSENIYCWGGSVPIRDFVDDSIGFEVSAVGAFHGYPVSGGTPVAKDASGNVMGAVAEIGSGYAFVWGDEWVIFTNQWVSDPTSQPYDDPYNPCYEQQAENVYQLPQFWYNALSYAGGSHVCLEIDEPTIVVR